MKTKQQAIAEFKQMYPRTAGYVYKFPAGHWNYCTASSPISRDLESTGEIYRGISAKEFYVVAS